MSVEKVRKQLMKQIDAKNEIQVEKVERYMNLLNLFYLLDESIEKMGTMIVTENGAQKFTKPNPALAEKNKINTSLLALEKSFNFPISNTEDDKDDGKAKGIDSLL